MDTFNRILIVLLLLTLFAAAVVVLLTTAGLLRPDTLALGPWLQDGLARVAARDGGAWLPALLASIALVLLVPVLIAGELSSARPEPDLLVKRDGLGRVTVAREALRSLACDEATRVQGVMEARADVRRARHPLRIACALSVDPAADVPAVTADVRRRVKDAVERHIGRRIAEVSVRTQLEPLGNGRKRVR